MIQGLSAKTLSAQARAKANTAYAEWAEGQGAKIRAARPQAVHDACVLLAWEQSQWRQPLILTAEEIAKCEQRAVSSARCQRFFAIPKSADDWRAQCQAIRAEWANSSTRSDAQ
jgi:hypothetical protein